MGVVKRTILQKQDLALGCQYIIRKEKNNSITQFQVRFSMHQICKEHANDIVWCWKMSFLAHHCSTALPAFVNWCSATAKPKKLPDGPCFITGYLTSILKDKTTFRHRNEVISRKNEAYGAASIFVVFPLRVFKQRPGCVNTCSLFVMRLKKGSFRFTTIIVFCLFENSYLQQPNEISYKSIQNTKAGTR